MLRQTHNTIVPAPNSCCGVRVPSVLGAPGRLRRHPPRIRRCPRGITAVLAMLFMVLIGVLALGFYSTVTTSMSLAKNDQKSARALLSAESGVQFMRYHLAHVSIPSPDSLQSPSQQVDTMLTNLAQDLCTRLSGTNGLTDSDFTYVPGSYMFSIPAASNRVIPIDGDGNGFRATIGNVGGGVSEVVCKVIGLTGSGTEARSKGVQIDFSRQQNKTSIFDDAIATKGKLVIKKGTIGGVSGISPDTIANLMSAQDTTPSLVMTGGSIGGAIGVVGSTDNASISGGTVHGVTGKQTMIDNNYLQVVDPPEFPTVNTSIFKQYATNTYTGSNTTLSNIRIPAGTNPTFSGNVTVQGIVYIESPNTVTFSGDTTLAGFIVVENTGTTAQNVINMLGNFSVTNLPKGAAYDPLRTITGVAVLAPTTALNMTGSVSSNFRGNVIVGTFANNGASDITLDKGSIVAMDTTADSAVFNTSKSVKFTSTGKDNQPSSGLTYSDHFVPSGGSYLELN